MATNPITLAPVGGLPYAVVKGHLVMLYTGAWILDLELSADSVQAQGVPSGKCVVLFGGVPMSGTIDPDSSGSFGPTAMVRVVAGGSGWSTSPPAQDWHADNGVLSTLVYESVATAVGEQLVDIVPTLLGVDVVCSSNDPAMTIFGDNPWFVDTTGTTFVGPRPPAIPDPSLVIREWDPVSQKATFSCDSLLIPNTPLVDPRFNGSLLTVYNVEQVFDGQGSTGWAWAKSPAIPGVVSTQPTPILIEALKAAALYWTRASMLRMYRYRLVLYEGDGPGGGPSRMALQAVTPSAGVPDILPIAPWSGVAGMVSELAPSQDVLVLFENADPTLPRVIGYSLVAANGESLMGLPLKTSIDATVELDMGITAPLVNLGAQALMVNLAGGNDFVALSSPITTFLDALQTWSAAAAGALNSAGFPIVSAQSALVAAIAAAVSSTPAVKTKAT